MPQQGQRSGRGGAAFAIAGLVVPLTMYAAVPAQAATRLAALTLPSPATVLTLEAGLVGAQNLVHFTPMQLKSAFCGSPNVCVPVDYPALPGQAFNEVGADAVTQKVNSLGPSWQTIILKGHSQGAQVIYSVLRRWHDDPASKQYDGWADWPDDPTNALAIVNAVAGMALFHPDYFNVDINDPANVRYTPTLANGAPGNVTYVWVPSPTFPMISGVTGRCSRYWTKRFDRSSSRPITVR